MTFALSVEGIVESYFLCIVRDYFGVFQHCIVPYSQ